jgi:Arc/MetJ-type ribon-helix-helix transcriptional regulator
MLVVFPATGMKYKLSISVDEATVLKVREGMRKGLFRNKSHAFEYAINEVLNEDVD